MPSILYIYEILENIFFHLPYYDLQQARLVCIYWNSLAITSLSIQKQLWKRPMICSDINAHFNNTWEDINILRQSIFLRKHRAFRRVLVEEIVSFKIWNQYEELENSFRRTVGDKDETENNSNYNIKRRLQVCNKCSSLHPEFRYSNIHPLPQSLERFICITGEGSTLIANIGIIGKPEHPPLLNRLFNIAICLTSISQKWQTVKDDMFTRPVCTRLVITSGCGCYVVQKRPGITIREAVIVLAWECYDSLNKLRKNDLDVFMQELNMADWPEINRLATSKQQDIAGMMYTKRKRTLETLRDYAVDRLSTIIALDVLDGKRKEDILIQLD